VKKLVLALLKIGISVGILAYLFQKAIQNDVFAQLRDQPKDWGLLLGAGVACFLAVVLTLIRWYYLVRALDLPFTLHEALRLGFLGYLFNLAPMGIVGGDLLKAVMLARQHPKRRPEAVASVFVDRIVGLHMLLVVATAAILATGMFQLPQPKIRLVCLAAVGATALGTVGIVTMLLPDFTGGRLPRLVERIPYAGATIVRLAAAVGLYRHRLPVLAASAAMSIGVHSLFTVGIYLITRGLYARYQPLAAQFVISPLTAATGVLPVSFGPFELGLDLLFVGIPLPDGARMLPGQGLVVALGYRIINVLTAAVGVVYYLASRQEVAAVLHEAEEPGKGQAEPAPVDSLA